MFSNVLQPACISLFSSTGSEPLQLWSLSLDTSVAPGSSAIQLLHDSDDTPLTHGGPTDSKSPHATNSASLIAPPVLVELGGALTHRRNSGADSQEANDDTTASDRGYQLDQTVLHIQSPNLPRTYIQCPPGPSSRGLIAHSLGLKYPWMHLQVRNLGRDWSFEVGIVDLAGRTGVLRMSTFQKHPKLKLNQTGRNAYPLLHLPLSFPSRSSRPLTAWTTINLHLPTFIPYFSHSNLLEAPDAGQANATRHTSSLPTSSLPPPLKPSPLQQQSWERMNSSAFAVPSGSYSHIAFVRVYATCRLRRIWLDGSGPDQNFPWEFGLFSSG